MDSIACRIASFASSNSLLTSILSAWNTFFAGCPFLSSLFGYARLMVSSSSKIVSTGRASKINSTMRFA